MVVGKSIETLGLYTDKYQLTMAMAMFHKAHKDARQKCLPKGQIEEPVNCSELYFRKCPFKGEYAVCAGLADAIELITKFNFSDEDIEYLKNQKQLDKKTPMYTEEFLSYLKNFIFSCDVDAVPEGTVVFPEQPLMRLAGPQIQVQLLETALLNIINFQTLIATKSARIKSACEKQLLLEFGLRRAQDQGGLAASRAAYIGGADATSNELAGQIYGIPTSGTHAHAFVMSFDSELEAFRAYAEALPSNCIFLVDTYCVKQGIENAITVGKELREKGHEMIGIRLDSGDLAKLSKHARKRLHDEGFDKAIIVASNDLDEETIEKLKQEGACIDVWGVGTQLATGGTQAALGGVYKLVATQKSNELGTYFVPKIKISEEECKTTNPGRHQVRRYYSEKRKKNGGISKQFLYDVLINIDEPLEDELGVVDPHKPEPEREIVIPKGTQYEDLLVPVYRNGDLGYALPTLLENKARANEQLAALAPEIKRLSSAQPYQIFFEKMLYDLKIKMIRA